MFFYTFLSYQYWIIEEFVVFVCLETDCIICKYELFYYEDMIKNGNLLSVIG